MALAFPLAAGMRAAPACRRETRRVAVQWLAAAGAGVVFWFGWSLLGGREADVWGLFRYAAPPRSQVLRGFLLLVVAYPVLEEVVFRGLIQGAMRARVPATRRSWGGISLANALTSVLFGAAHVLRHDAGWAAAMFLPSLVFGYFRDRTGGLRASVALHVFYNAGYFWLFGW